MKYDLISIDKISQGYNVSSDFVYKTLLQTGNVLNIKMLYSANSEDIFTLRDFFVALNDTSDSLEKLVYNKQSILNTCSDFVTIKPFCGVYFLIKEAEIVYIGQTKSLLTRIGEHRKDKNFDKIQFYYVDACNLLLVERINIWYHKPALNTEIITNEIYFETVLRETDIQSIFDQ